MNLKPKNHHLLLLLIIVFSLSSCGQKTKTEGEKPTGEISIVDYQFVKENVVGKSVQLIDVRSVEEFEAGSIDDAVNYNISQGNQFMEQIQNLDKEAPVYVFCKLGGRSARAAKVLQEQGFKEIYDYSGGYNDWILKNERNP